MMTNKEASDILKRIRDGLDEMVELNDRSREAFDAALAALEVERWIPCQERLPESKTAYYIVTLESRGRIYILPNDIDIARWDYDHRKGNDSWHWCKERKVIAWMPLPSPYQREGDPK